MSYFVTGATGFIGRHLVKELLDREASRGEPIYLLVRPESLAKLDALRVLWGEQAKRVIAVEGDLSRDRLGVSAVDLEKLKGKVAHFFHVGALYDLDAGDKELITANVDGTRNALEWAHAVGAGCFHHFSSIAAAGLYDGVFTEDMFDEAYGLEHPYFRTKHDAETIVRNEGRIAWRIYRPGMVVGDSRTGYITKIDGPYYFFKMQQLLRRNLPSWFPTIGFEGGYANIVPVDYVVRAVVHLAHLSDNDRRCFHITDPDARRVGELMNLFARAGHAPLAALRIDSSILGVLPKGVVEAAAAYEPIRDVFEQLLHDLRIPKTALKFLDLPTRFDNLRTRSLLESAGIRLPRIEDYAWRLWDYWERYLDPDLDVVRNLRAAVKGKRVLITGGNTGIGKATALKLAEAGATVLVASLGEAELEATRREIETRGAKAGVYVCDLTDEEQCRQLVERINAEHGGVDILVNNAGHSIRRSIEVSYERFHDYERSMRINYFAAVRLTLALLPKMAAQLNGHVIMISSIGVLSNQPRFSAYIASKAALESFARCASSEYRDRGVAFTVVNMPLVRTRMIAPTAAYRHAHTLSPEEAADIVVEAIVHRAPRVTTRLGSFARFMDLFAPKVADIINATAYRMFPDSAAALGHRANGTSLVDEAPTTEAMAFAKLTKGLHW